MTHVVIRENCSDFNASSPFLEKNTTARIMESGIKAEENLFGSKINWHKSVYNLLNFGYLESFCHQLLVNKQKEKFEVNTANVCVQEEDPLTMAIDYMFEEPIIFE